MFYRAWRQAQPAATHDRPAEDRYRTYIGALFGHGSPDWQRPGRELAQAKRHFAGHLGRAARHPEGLAAILEGYFGVPVRVQTFSPRWMQLPRSQCSSLGGAGGLRRGRWRRGLSRQRQRHPRPERGDRLAGAGCPAPLRHPCRSAGARQLPAAAAGWRLARQGARMGARVLRRGIRRPAGAAPGGDGGAGSEARAVGAARLEHLDRATAAAMRRQPIFRCRSRRSRRASEHRGGVMSEISRVQLFGKLNPVLYKAIEGATVFAKLRGNPVCRIRALAQPDPAVAGLGPASDPAAFRGRCRGPREGRDRCDRPAAARRHGAVGFVAAHRGCGRARLGLRHAAVRRKPGPQRPPAGRHAEDVVAAQRARCPISRQFERIKLEALCDDFGRITGGSPEAGLRASDGFSAAAPGRSERCDGAGADGQAGGAQAIRRRPHREGAQERDRSGHRPRRGDPPDRRHPDAAAAEQSDPHRRGRRRQDGGGRGLRGAARARRRAAAAEGRVAADARHRAAAGGRQHEGRVRAAPAPGDRRGAGEPQADHPVHRRDPHPGRRRRRGRHRRRGQPAQAGAGARQPSHHRRHHLGRVQEVHREGSGADPPLPGGPGARAGRGQGDPDAARRRQHAGEPSSRAAARSGHRGGGAAVASLHPGAAAARQGGEPARHRLRAGGGQPACDATGGRRLPAPHRGPRDRGAHHRQGVGRRRG